MKILILIKERVLHFIDMLNLKIKIDFHNFILFLTLLYFVLASILLIYYRAGFSFSQLAVLAIFLFMLIFAKSADFLKDWTPFALLFLSYEFLRGLIPLSDPRVNIYSMINFDFALFGYLPNVKLQEIFLDSFQYRWYDYALAVLYSVHLVIPLLAGVFFWRKSKKIFRRYVLAVIIVSYASFLTYILYPAMPPWFASEQGFIPPVYKVIKEITASFGYPAAMPSVYKYKGVNVNAAVPSLHVAYPFMILLFFARYFKKFISAALLYVLGIWFAVIYLGEHYFADIVVGTAYTTLAFYLSLFIFNKKDALREIVDKKFA